MTWHTPIPYKLKRTQDSMSFQTMGVGETGLPLAPHPGAFGIQRRFHWHEGVDLYAPAGTPVLAVESGVVVAIVPFTGKIATGIDHNTGKMVPLDWWHDTYAVLVEGASGVVLYGEIASHVKVGQKLVAGEILGVVIKVLKKDKGRPMCMLHLELHDHGTLTNECWTSPAKPETLRDPTPYLLPISTYE